MSFDDLHDGEITLACLDCGLPQSSKSPGYIERCVNCGRAGLSVIAVTPPIATDEVLDRLEAWKEGKTFPKEKKQ
jgi:hypothetical protein